MIFASNNAGKIKEVKEIFYFDDVKSLSECNIDIDVVEDADTFSGNAIKKAKEIYEVVGEPVLADDSGLCIDVLDGWPGIYTDRFMGVDATNDQKMDAIIKNMYGVVNRTANVVCCMAYYDGVNLIVCTGVLKGTITKEKRGENGFGFDEIFELDSGETLAEVSNELKNRISARSKALFDIADKINIVKNGVTRE